MLINRLPCLLIVHPIIVSDIFFSDVAIERNIYVLVS